MKKLVTKSMLIVLIMLVMIINLTVVSNAASSMDVKLSASSAELEVGEEITVTISLANINVGEGVNTLKGTVSWDKDVLEFVDYEKSVNDWSNTWNSTDGTLVSVHLSGLVKADTAIAKLTFKVKDVEELEETTITLADIESANTEEKVNPSDASITLKVKEVVEEGTGDSEEEGTNNNGSEENTTTNTTNTTTTTTNTTNTTNTTTTTTTTSTTNTSANTIIPYAGMSNTIIITTIIGLFIIGIISYVQYKKYREI